jgi:uncharacterized membrane protein
MLLRETLLFLHLVGAAAWIGGMLTMVMAVRPPMVLIELPAQRLRYVTAVMARLFALVAVAIAVIFATGPGTWAEASTCSRAACRRWSASHR